MEITDVFKYPLEKLVYFIASTVPGGVALLIYVSSSKTALQWFSNLGFLGYRTKLWLVVLAAFVIGHTLTNLLSALVNDLGFIIAEMIGRWSPWSSKSSFEYEDAPWRSVEWRNAVKQRLGAAAPRDSRLLTVDMMRQEQKLADYLPDAQKSAEAQRILNERITTILDDMRWSTLYSHYHQVLLQPSDQDVQRHIRGGLSFNFFAAALYVLVSAAIVPEVRHWWCIVPAAAWVFAVAAEFVAQLRRAFDKWSTLQDQIAYLSSGQV